MARKPASTTDGGVATAEKPKTTRAKAAAKPAAPTETAAKAATLKKPAAKKPAAKPTAPAKAATPAKSATAAKTAAPKAAATKPAAKTASAKTAAKAPSAKPVAKATSAKKSAAAKKPTAKTVREELLTFRPEEPAPLHAVADSEPPVTTDRSDTVVPFKPEPARTPEPEPVAAADEPVAVESRFEPRDEPVTPPRPQAKVDVPKEYAGKPRGFIGRLFDALTGKKR